MPIAAWADPGEPHRSRRAGFAAPRAGRGGVFRCRALIRSVIGASCLPELRARPRLRPQTGGRSGLLAAAAAAAVLAAAALVVPVVPALAQTAHRPQAPAPASAPERALVPALAPGDLDVVLAYVDGQRQDDPLIEVRPGVFAKRSNVRGVQLGGRTVYYDLVAHQSFGPLRAGTARRAEVEVLAHAGTGSHAVVLYALRR